MYACSVIFNKNITCSGPTTSSSYLLTYLIRTNDSFPIIKIVPLLECIKIYSQTHAVGIRSHGLNLKFQQRLRPRWPDWVNFWAAFFHWHKEVKYYFWPKVVWATFWAIFNKLIWSPWLRLPTQFESSLLHFRSDRKSFTFILRRVFFSDFDFQVWSERKNSASTLSGCSLLKSQEQLRELSKRIKRFQKTSNFYSKSQTDFFECWSGRAKIYLKFILI
jgi:hypothetical protein